VVRSVHRGAAQPGADAAATAAGEGRRAGQSSNALYGSFRYPESYVIDKSGVVRRKLIGPQDWTNPEIVEYLRKLAS